MVDHPLCVRHSPPIKLMVCTVTPSQANQRGVGVDGGMLTGVKLCVSSGDAAPIKPQNKVSCRRDSCFLHAVHHRRGQSQGCCSVLHGRMSSNAAL